MIKKATKKVDVAEEQPVVKVLVLRTCNAKMQAHSGFQWPEIGPVEAPDWSPVAECGHGLHGYLWGEGDGGLLNRDPSAKWLVVEVDAGAIVDLGRKVKFPRGVVVHCGDQKSATEYIATNGAAGKAIIGAFVTGGHYATMTGGDYATMTGGQYAVFVISRWNGKRYKMYTGYVKDGNGDGELEPNVAYELNEKGEFVKVEVHANA